jgi:hypothetical protein
VNGAFFCDFYFKPGILTLAIKRGISATLKFPVLYGTNFEKTILHSSEEPPLQELRSFLFPTVRIVTSPQRQGITK